MVIFRPDGEVAFVNSSRTAELDVINVRSHRVIKRITGLVSPFSPNLAASPDGLEVWLTHKDVGKATIVDAQNFTVLGVIDTGPTTNHVNFVSRPDGDFAYVSVGDLNQVKVYRRNGGSPQLVTSIPTGAEPHGIWPSPDNTRVYVSLENQDAVQVIDTVSNSVIKTVPIGQMPQALVYVANAVPSGDGRHGLTKQGLNLRVEATAIAVLGGGEANVVLRELINVDSVEVNAQGLTPGAKYQVYAVKDDGTRQLIADFVANAKGKGSVNPLLKFFAAGFSRVEVQIR
jgi:YVTN family beta-propeller protein